MQARLILNSPDNAERELKLSLPATVGRGRDAKVKLIHSKVSRLHCEFFEQNGVLYVRDLGSTNGTFVGDQKADEPTPIRPGETVTIGEVKFQAMYASPDGGLMPPVPADAAADTVRTGKSEATFRARPAPSAPPAAPGKAADSGELQLEDLPPAAEAPAEASDADDFQLLPVDNEPKIDEDFDPTTWLNEPADSNPPSAPKSQRNQQPQKKSPDDDDLDEFLKGLE